MEGGGSEAAPRKKRDRSAYQRQRYAASEQLQVQSYLANYRRRYRAGESYAPRPWSKFALWCAGKGFDPISLIEGRQKAPWDV